MKRANEIQPRRPLTTCEWYDDDCWVIAVATFFAISHAAAYRLIVGKDRPCSAGADGGAVNLGIERELLERRLIELGMERVDVDYRSLRRPALVLAYWDFFRTAHLVVWDGKNRCRIDPCWRDTLLLNEKRTIIHAVFVRR